MDLSEVVWVVKPKRYQYRPQPDITVYELALILPIFAMKGDVVTYIDSLPPEAKRHFVASE